MMQVRVMDLFDAFKQNKLPKDQAYIVSSFVNVNTGYTIYEVISYSSVKAIYPDGAGITFQSTGKKMHILIEPISYPNKPIEPYLRVKDEQIPYRFKELNEYIAKNQTKIFLSKKPTESLSSFTVNKPIGFNVSFVFYSSDDVYQTMTKFFELSFNKDAGIPQVDSAKVAKECIKVIQNTMSFHSEYGG